MFICAYLDGNRCEGRWGININTTDDRQMKTKRRAVAVNAAYEQVGKLYVRVVASVEGVFNEAVICL